MINLTSQPRMDPGLPSPSDSRLHHYRHGFLRHRPDPSHFEGSHHCSNQGQGRPADNYSHSAHRLLALVYTTIATLTRKILGISVGGQVTSLFFDRSSAAVLDNPKSTSLNHQSHQSEPQLPLVFQPPLF
jgi:hypothetical protein